MSSTPRVTERDREYMRRIGRYKAEANAEALREHLSRTGSERLARAVSMMIEGPVFAARVPRDDDPGEFYDRARRLGLYRSR